MNQARQPADRPGALARARGALAVLIALPGLAAAGDMDGVGYAILALYVYIGVAVVVGIGALVACRWIRDPRWRLIARWLIVILLYTPVPLNGSAFPAFMVAWSPYSAPQAGPLGHPIALAYAGMLLLSGPTVALWLYTSRRYGRGADLASHAHRASATSSAAAHAPPT